MDIDLSDYIAGEYFIMKYVNRADANSPELIPDRIISISQCRGDVLDLYSYDDIYHREYLVKFGVLQDKRDDFRVWRTEKQAVDIGYPNVFYNPNSAHEFVTEFLSHRDDILLVGIGLHHTLLESFLTATVAEKKRLNPNGTRMDWDLNLNERVGVDRVLSTGEPLPPGEHILGFDIAAYTVQFVCSWLCTCGEFDLEEQFGLKANQYGLIDDFEVAKVAQTWREGDASYEPWLLVQYPI
jgi:hypothetical protein